ncbi:adenine phosphoribosyltransferase [Luteimonas sp. SJ-92]|uniref:Adenine phosphoribosyltransferase n=1 Tax=Luteimonas salinisoli TaxID=2752307 RepID=A0A853JAE8_9GAMM|nr:adenine phosphoribosyltransferase [Luteimonas salinisoli]NZA25638.1 adenine phosphoribosyltransferase [Luteimonas salinisoli]
MSDWQTLVRDVPDFPKPGIAFKDITPALADPAAFAAAVEAMAAPWRDAALDAVAGIESRGFILGAALAQALRTGFVPIRKPGKLPARALAQDYALEYGSDRLEVHADALPPGARVLLVDDVLATGGTLLAALALLQRQGAAVAGAAVLIELQVLGGRAHWRDPTPLIAAAAQ